MAEPGANQMFAAIRSGTRIMIELPSQISVLDGMSLDPPLDTLPATIVGIHDLKAKLTQRIIAIDTSRCEAL
jgi:hypothetical protein